jgi:predicted metal-dependent phosphoesterase TrpH
MMDTILFEKPDIAQISSRGLTAVDMHFHTNHSDSPTTVKDALKLAEKRGVGLAITDHNQISGVIEAYEMRTGVLVIPGIEISAREGPHILVYFYTISEMQEFYDNHIAKNKRESPYLATTLTIQDIIENTEDYNCLTVAAHPYGYSLLIRGVQKCVDGEYLDQKILTRFEAIEVICGSMGRKLNMKAAILASTFEKGITGGTDGHLLNDLGNVVTCSDANDVEEFLTNISRRKNVVIGLEKNILRKSVMAMIVLPKYLKYTIPSLRIHYEQNMPRVKRLGKRALYKLKGSNFRE